MAQRRAETIAPVRPGLSSMTTTFVSALTVREYTPSLTRNSPDYNAIPCKDGVHSLSIQASHGHYCEPRITTAIANYTEWEVAICGPDGLVVPEESDPVFGPFAEHWAGDTVAGYVPTERVQALYEAACLGIRTSVSKHEPKVQKIVINTCYGGFSVSKAVFDEMGLDWDGYGYIEVERDDPRLVAAVEKLGDAANGHSACLRVVEIPLGVKWRIHDYDGREHIAEEHRTWR